MYSMTVVYKKVSICTD